MISAINFHFFWQEIIKKKCSFKRDIINLNKRRKKNEEILSLFINAYHNRWRWCRQTTNKNIKISQTEKQK